MDRVLTGLLLVKAKPLANGKQPLEIIRLSQVYKFENRQ